MESRILLVDDDPNLLAALRRRLGRKYSVTAVMSAEDDLSAVADQGPYAVVLSDQRMQRLDGVSFLRRLRDSAPETIRIMLTGNADPMTEIRATEEAEVFRFLAKPCPFEEIVASIEMALGHTAGGTAEQVA